MRKLIISFALLSSSTVLAAPNYPVATRNAEEFSPQTREAVDKIWNGLYAKAIEHGQQQIEFNPKECRVFESYAMTILKKLIRASSLENQTRDLMLFMDCYNLSRFPLGAKLRSRTMELNQGYMGTLGSEDELAAVVAHELSHHILRHEESLQLILPPTPTATETVDMFAPSTPDAATLRLYKSKQKFEDEADINSVAILANAGYSYLGAVNLLNRVARSQRGASSQHSEFSERIQMIEDKARSFRLQPSPVRPFPPTVKSAIGSYFGPEGEKDQNTLRPAGSGRISVSD